MSESEPTLYEVLGGEDGLRRLVNRFYHHMHHMEDARSVRAMHPDDLSGSEDKLFRFLSGWTGGPPLFTQKFGNPMLRRRHLSFAIGKAERDQWMVCMLHALEDVGVQEPVRSFMMDAFLKLADHMRNQGEG